jgi:tRNA(Ile)-lysidine synthase
MLIDQVRKTITHYDLVRKHDTVVLGVSGGPDSMALLYLFHQLKKELQLTLVVAHLDHMLRKDSAGDAAYVRRQAQKLALPCICAAVPIKKMATGGSPEENARNVRLAFLCRIARDIKANRIALGHTLDDQAETVLMRLIRGAGLYGLQAIVPRRSLGGYEFIRPLIAVRRSGIERYLKTKKIRPRIDRSNFSDLYLRNNIRRELLPFIERKYNKNIKAVLAHLAESAGADYDYLMQAAAQKIRRWGRRLPLLGLTKLHPALKNLVIRMTILRLKGDLRAINFQHTREIEDLLVHRPTRSIVDLPKGISCIKTAKYLSFFRRP